jgi:hypothetical protein
MKLVRHRKKISSIRLFLLVRLRLRRGVLLEGIVLGKGAVCGWSYSVGSGGWFLLRRLPPVLRRGCLFSVPLLLRGTISLRLTWWAFLVGGGVGLAALLAFLGGQVWSLLFSRNVIVFRSSSRLSDSGRWYCALRSRTSEQGFSSALETDRGPLPFVVWTGWLPLDGELSSGVNFRYFWWMRTPTILGVLVCWCLVSWYISILCHRAMPHHHPLALVRRPPRWSHRDPLRVIDEQF